ncbi:hypothetical protein [Variovorax sp. UMC13]|uniref:hypothetical protein n=1 Tax=Variovorax sp. UMC13 TaxID=1862326 RepID=UPI001C8232B2|nr:hypothetical protein [Variovorax sp. UMC13]MBB1599942.1 hypothetical protein [Variovorax sp. UMC13]
MELTGLKALREANAIAVHWWSVMEMISEQAKYGEGRKDTVPKWVLNAIGDWRSQHAAHDAHKAHMERAGQALRIAGEGPTSLVYELWTDRGHRLDGQYDFRADADAALPEWLAQYPDAKVTLVHRQSPTFGGTVDPALLDTLIGRTFWAGCFFADEQHQQDIHTVQDETGRCAYAPTSELLAHPCFSRMTRKGQERVQFSASEATRKAQLRALAEKGGA